MNQLSLRIKKFRESKGWSKAELGRRLGDVSGQLIGQYESDTEPKTPGGDFFIKWKNAFGVDLLDETKVSHENKLVPEANYNEQSLNNLTESNKILAEANRTLADANKTLAEANHVISKNHDELIQLTKMIVSSSNRQIVSEEHPVSDKKEGLHPAFGDLGLDKRYSKGKKTAKGS